ncbi:hypothetical protein EST38_g8099 [Candolleomyces aberdarensis]|uniref:Xylanolytic transcriptional activator regulatory domain-containing protein n=1 Tax=Candolleomyces aberdarensis TaxID=2316362 RepID=A0A4V1Q389_9AGAR|nr:hypothetical protein EST38_g8099 [Candolleomyces aberdarensis]
MHKSGQGLAVWNPRPNNPDANEQGVVPGDVGTFSAREGFKKIFNIVEDSQAIRTSKPSQNEFISPELDAPCKEALPLGHTFAQGTSTDVEFTSDGRALASGAFRCLAPKGAVLALTSPADLHELKDRIGLRDFIINHALLLYRYANSIRRLDNDESLYFVTGCIKSDSWALAAFNEPVDHPNDVLRLVQTGGGSGMSALTYAWTSRGTAEAWTGSNSTRGRHDYTGRNQCLFLRGYKMAFSPEFRLRISGHSPSPGGPGSGHGSPKSDSSNGGGDRYDGSYTKKDSPRGGSHGGSKFNSFNGSTPSPGNACSHDLPVVQAFPMYQEAQYLHPCDSINERLLDETRADCALSHDDDWRFVFENIEDYESFDPLESNLISVQNGVAFLTPAPNNPDLVNTNTSIPTDLLISIFDSVDKPISALKLEDQERRELKFFDMNLGLSSTESSFTPGADLDVNATAQAPEEAVTAPFFVSMVDEVYQIELGEAHRSIQEILGYQLSASAVQHDLQTQPMDQRAEIHFSAKELMTNQDGWCNVLRRSVVSSQEDEPMDVDNNSMHDLIAPTQRLTLSKGGDFVTYGSTSMSPFRSINIQSAPLHFPAIVNRPDNTYVLLLEDVDECHYNPDLDWARYLPGAVPLDRRGHDKALDLVFKFLTSWYLGVVPPLFLHDMCQVLSMPRGQMPPKTAHYSPMLHNAILAVGLAFLDDPAVQDYKARHCFAEEAKKYIETEFSSPSLCSVAALSMIATFHSSQGDETLGFMYFGLNLPSTMNILASPDTLCLLGMSARMSQVLGLNMDCSEWMKLGLIEETVVLDRYWTYWTTFAQDVSWSLYVGRDICVPEPSELEFDMPVPFVDSELDQIPFTHPGVPTQPSLLSKTFATTCELLVIARRIMNIVNGINKTRVGQSVIEEQITDIDLQLNTWKSTLHPDVDLTPKNKFAATPHKLMLHIAYWWQFILLHRPYLHQCPEAPHNSKTAINHSKLCRHAAEHIMDLLAVWRQLYTLRYCPITLAQPLFAAGTIFLLSGVQATSGIRVAQKETKICVDSIKLLLQYLREIGKSWQCALNIESILRALVEKQLKPAIEKRQSAVPKDRLTGSEAEREKYRIIPPVRRRDPDRVRPRQSSTPAIGLAKNLSEYRTPIMNNANDNNTN